MLYFVSVGLDKSGVTRAAEKKIAAADYVVVRSTKLSSTKGMKYDLSLDDLYTESKDFDELNMRAADKLVELSRQYGSVAYVTDDAVDDAVCIELYSRGESFEMTGLGIAPPVPVASYLKLSAYDIKTKPYIDSGVPLFVYGIDNKLKAAEVKLYLMKFYDFTCRAIFSRGGTKKEITIEELDRQVHYNYSAGIFVPAQTQFNKRRSGFGDLMRIISRLTAPNGCPWDKIQTHESIRTNMIEEAYEAVDAIDNDDIDAMVEEFGDVILQSVLNSDIAERSGEFDIGDVLSMLCAKLYGRHTHIFGSDHAVSASDALSFWENAKEKEKKYESLSDKLERIPDAFPALLKMQKMISKVAKAGIDLGDARKLIEESLATENPDLDKLLFACVLLCRECGADAEIELTETANKFRKKFVEADGEKHENG